MTPGDENTATWYTSDAFTFDTADINGATVAVANFILTDGEEGDDTAADASIADDNGPGVSTSSTGNNNDGLAGVLADTGSNPLTYVAGGVLLIIFGLYIARRNSPKTFSIHQ